MGVRSTNREGGAGQQEPATGSEVGTNAHVCCKFEFSARGEMDPDGFGVMLKKFFLVIAGLVSIKSLLT